MLSEITEGTPAWRLYREELQVGMLLHALNGDPVCGLDYLAVIQKGSGHFNGGFLKWWVSFRESSGAPQLRRYPACQLHLLPASTAG
jgi:hypothetical protein